MKGNDNGEFQYGENRFLANRKNNTHHVGLLKDLFAGLQERGMECDYKWEKNVKLIEKEEQRTRIRAGISFG